MNEMNDRKIITVIALFFAAVVALGLISVLATKRKKEDAVSSAVTSVKTSESDSAGVSASSVASNASDGSNSADGGGQVISHDPETEVYEFDLTESGLLDIPDGYVIKVPAQQVSAVRALPESKTATSNGEKFGGSIDEFYPGVTPLMYFEISCNYVREPGKTLFIPVSPSWFTYLNNFVIADFKRIVNNMLAHIVDDGEVYSVKLVSRDLYFTVSNDY